MGRRIIVVIGIILLALFVCSCKKEPDLDKRDNERDALQEDKAENLVEEKQNTFFESELTIMDSHREVEPVINKDDVNLKENVNTNVLLTEVIQDEEDMEEIRRKVRSYPAGTILEISGIENFVLEALFYSGDITEDMKDRINGKSYGVNCDLSYSELRYIRVMHQGFDDQVYIGELIVNQAIAEDMIEIMKELFENEYPIERMVLVDEYDADDNKSMEDNNSSAFNYRNIDGTSSLSLHSYGLAIDINPLYNPFVCEKDGKTIVLPDNGLEYVDRKLDCSYYITKGDACYQAFIKRGFTWGGEWKNSKDYQHFQKEIPK